MLTRARRQAAALLMAAGLLAACTPSIAPTPEAPILPEPEAPAVSYTVSEAWVTATDQGSAEVYGVIENPGSRDLHIVAASSPSTDHVQLHEALAQGTASVMGEMPDGFLLPAAGSYSLEPQGGHIMLLNLSESIEPGTDVEITLHAADGTEIEFSAPVRAEAP